MIDLAGRYFWHCTSFRGFRRIMASGEIRPNRGELRCQHELSRVSCCYRLSAVSLFDSDETPSFFTTWRKFHKPLTVALKIDGAALMPNIVCRTEAQETAPGLMIRGEVCHRGPIPSEAITGCLFVRARQPNRTAFLRAAELTPANIAAAIRKLRRSRDAEVVPLTGAVRELMPLAN